MGRVTWKTLSLPQYTSRQRCHGANAEIKSKALMWHIDLSENAHAVFVLILHHRKDKVSLLDNQQRRRRERLAVHHQTGILSDDITSPGAHHKTVHLPLFSTRSTIDLLLIFDCTAVLVTEYLCLHLSSVCLLTRDAPMPVFLPNLVSDFFFPTCWFCRLQYIYFYDLLLTAPTVMYLLF